MWGLELGTEGRAPHPLCHIGWRSFPSEACSDGRDAALRAPFRRGRVVVKRAGPLCSGFLSAGRGKFSLAAEFTDDASVATCPPPRRVPAPQHPENFGSVVAGPTSAHEADGLLGVDYPSRVATIGIQARAGPKHGSRCTGERRSRRQCSQRQIRSQSFQEGATRVTAEWRIEVVHARRRCGEAMLSTVDSATGQDARIALDTTALRTTSHGHSSVASFAPPSGSDPTSPCGVGAI